MQKLWFPGRIERRIESIENRLALAFDRSQLFQMERLGKLLKKIEPYQPIFRIAHAPLLSHYPAPKRDCLDRVEAICRSMKADWHGLHVLDAGSSLGFISLSLAERGAQVTGLEMNPLDREASYLISQLSGVPASFVQAELDEAYVDSLPANHFHVGLFLSVFHHVIARHGLEAGRRMAAKILSKIPICYFELAVREEEVDCTWREGLPENPLDLFEGLPVTVELVGLFPNHLSRVPRPLYRVRAKSVLKVNDRAYLYERMEVKAHPNSKIPANRRYYFSGRYFIKEVVSEADPAARNGILQAANEAFIMRRLGDFRFLEESGLRSPELLDFEITAQAVRLVFERAPGRLLLEVCGLLDEDQKCALLEKVERGALLLQKRGVFLNDLRLWNLLYDLPSQEVTLIDLGLSAAFESENLWASLAWLAAELDQERVLSVDLRRDSIVDAGLIPWHSPRLREKFELYADAQAQPANFA